MAYKPMKIWSSGCLVRIVDSTRRVVSTISLMGILSANIVGPISHTKKKGTKQSIHLVYFEVWLPTTASFC